uniref:Uncharacterized protein n=1 Tax=Moniliophthora roreri TaxID=221103 RepID=A0A0W0FER0_MONRR
MPTNVVFVFLTSVESVFMFSISFLKATNSVLCTLIETSYLGYLKTIPLVSLKPALMAE